MEQGSAIGRLGITLGEGPRTGRPAWWRCIARVRIDASVIGVAKTWEMSSLTVQMLWRIVTGQVSAKNISGPISIAEFAGHQRLSGADRVSGVSWPSSA